MRVGVEASSVFQRNKTGVGYYAHNLVEALTREMPGDDIILSYISFFTRTPERLNPSPKNVLYRRFSLIPGRVYNGLDHYLIAPPIDLLTRARADVFFFPNFFLWPLLFCRKSVVAIHDLTFLDMPEYIVPRHRLYLSRRVPQSVRKASHVVAVSEYTKQRLVQHYGIDAAKITVVVPAIDQAQYVPSSPPEVEKTRQKYGISGEYLLFLGTIEPRKNIAGIIEAYAALPRELQERYQLVLAGGKGWLDDQINRLAAALPESRLVRTGYVDDEDKPALYTGATIFLYPSHYEGWGMQIPEAMACGTPVITARNSSLPEAGGEAAIYVESTDTPDLSKQIVDLLGDESKRAKMSAAGLAYARRFSWEASAKRLAKVLRELGPK